MSKQKQEPQRLDNAGVPYLYPKGFSLLGNADGTDGKTDKAVHEEWVGAA